MEMRALAGVESLPALNVFSTLMLGLNQLPMYRAMRFEQFLTSVEKMPAPDQEKIIREALMFVNLDPTEVLSVVRFFNDPNGVPYCRQNIDSVGLKDIFNMIVEACKAVVQIAVTLLTPDEKKN